MRAPVIRGVIDRRLLINYRMRPEVMAALLPRPFRPQLVNGFALAGVCLIRLKEMRPRGWPAVLGVTSENAAYRFAVEWEHDGAIQQGVYVPRRDTSSRLNALIGGRLYPGVHGHAEFSVNEDAGVYHVAVRSDDGATRIDVTGHSATEFTESSVFGSLSAASEFLQCGSRGWSPTSIAGQFDCLHLRSSRWTAEPWGIDRLRDSFFDDRGRFPAGSIEFDCALLMRDIEHEWHVGESLVADQEVDAA